VRGVGRVDRRYLGQRPPVVDVDLACQIPEATEKDKSRLRVERDEVVEGRPEIVQRPDALIEKHRLRRHGCKQVVKGKVTSRICILQPDPNSFELGLQAKS
jgi:hypothetical protein